MPRTGGFACSYELLICERCGRERVRTEEGQAIVRCDCGGEDFALYDLVPVPRDPDVRFALAQLEPEVAA